MNATPGSHPLHNGWIAARGRDPRARVRLFCFPYAGVGASIFRAWPERLPGVDVCRVQLPGRETRMAESPLRRLTDLVDRAIEGITPHVDDVPYALFGHSLGSIVAFEVARRLRDSAHLSGPVHLIVGARRAPRLPSRFPSIAHLPDPELIGALDEIFGSGIPEDVLREPELLELLLPTLRADIEASESYSYVEAETLSCGVTALGGVDDPSALPDEVQAWKEETHGPFTFGLIQGGHFFAKDDSAQLFRIIGRALASHASAGSVRE